MKFNPLVLALMVGLTFSAVAVVPPAEQLLPADTLGVLSVPDWSKVVAARKDSALMQLWNEPAMRPLKEKFLARFAKEVIEPLERQLGVKLTNYADLVQGQFTLAVTQNGWTGSPDPAPGFILILDTREKAEQLKTQLADLKKKLTDSGEKVRTDKIRDVEFTTLKVDMDTLGKSIEKKASAGGDAATEKKEAAPDAKDEDQKPGQKVELSFGQAGSLLLVGTSVKDIEKVLVRLAGGSSPCLAEQPAFDANQKAYFRDALCFGWVNFAPLTAIINKSVAEAAGRDPNPNPLAPKPEKILAAVGLNGLQTIALGVKQTGEGGFVDFFLGVPEDKRAGLFKMLTPDVKDANPPAFVPSDAVQFNRCRLDGQKFWSSFETMFNDISPGMLGFWLAQIETALKEKDPSFDFRKNLVGNLGNDIITYQKAPRGATLAELNAPPSLFLLGSAKAEALLGTIRAVMGLARAQFGGGDFKEREFLGRKIYSIPLPQMPGAEDPKVPTLHLAASGGYVAITTDAAMVEEYLRSSETKSKPLAETAGMIDAAQKVGGTANGLFGYQNDVEIIRTLFNVAKNDSDVLTKALSVGPVGLSPAMDGDNVKAWIDLSLLPPFESVSKYFNMTVFAGKTGADGFALKVFCPVPPQMKQ